MSREEFLSAIYMIIKNEKGEILFQRRCGSKLWPDFLGLPAGHVDKGEDVYQALVREAREELNIDNLKEKLYKFVTSKNINNNATIITNSRHINSLKDALKNINNAIQAIDNMIDLSLISIDIKNAWLSLGDITGNSDNEKIIDDIFSKFCVGK